MNRLIRMLRQMQDMSCDLQQYQVILVICYLNDMHYKRVRMERFFFSVLLNIRYLAGQALPLRRDWNTETMSEENSNLQQLLSLRAQEDPEII